MKAPRDVVYNKKIKAGPKLVALWLYDHMMPGSYKATGSLETIARDLGMRKQTVLECIRVLLEHGVILYRDQDLNHRNIVYNVYPMRSPLPEAPREVKARKPRLKNPPGAFGKPKEEKFNPGAYLPFVAPDNGKLANCSLCKGSGYQFNERTKESRKCPQCRGMK
jgi:transcription initiation factor IIE alpha subunit